jgi:UDP-GlcNAc:undecaprenyl-phosphate/decaprenyl-phosphate GlcNAc-1-phosphate transferase
MTLVYYPALFIFAFSLSLAFSPLVRRFAFAIGAVDLPGERKIHSVPIPRIGGLVIALSIALTLIATRTFGNTTSAGLAVSLSTWWPLLIGATIVFLGGVCDDIRPLPAWGKFLIQAIAAATAIVLGVRIDHVSLLGSDSINLASMAMPITFLWIVGITNAFNLIDGLDGLAVGLGSIAAGTCAMLFFLRGDAQEALLLVIVLGALLGFLPHNFNPARMYLGDSGSMLIGYVLAVTAIVGTQKTATAVAVFVPFLVLGLPIIDTLFSMVRRFSGHQKKYETSWLQAIRRMFEADQAHFHHRLMALGLSHRNAVIRLYTVAIGLSICALLSVIAEYRNAGIVILTVILATAIGIGKLEYREVDLLPIGRLLRWYDRLAFHRNFFVGFLDLFLIMCAFWAAFGLKFYDSEIDDRLAHWYLNAFPHVLITQFLCLYVFGLYRGVWRTLGVGDLVKVALAVSIAAAASYSLVVIRQPPGGTLSFFVIDCLLLGFFTAGMRSVYRVLDYSKQHGLDHGGATLIYGAGRGGQLVLRELMQNTALGLRAIGFIDDDPKLLHRTISGLPVLGNSHNLSAILDNHLITTVLISAKSIQADHMKEVVAAGRDRGVSIFMTGLELHPIAQGIHSLNQATFSTRPAA